MKNKIIIFLFMYCTFIFLSYNEDFNNENKFIDNDKKLTYSNQTSNLNNLSYNKSEKSQTDYIYSYNSDYYSNIEILSRYKNPYHIAAAEKFGIKVKSAKTLKKLVEKKKFIKIDTCENYIIGDLTSSHPYVIPQMVTLLDEIGKEFSYSLKILNLPHYRFYISSCTRTLTDQKRLRRSNPNAGKKSSHSYGVSVDISYVRFSEGYNKPAPDDDIIKNDFFLQRQKTPEKIFTSILARMQNENKCIVIYEKFQRVFHLTILPNPIDASFKSLIK